MSTANKVDRAIHECRSTKLQAEFVYIKGNLYFLMAKEFVCFDSQPGGMLLAAKGSKANAAGTVEVFFDNLYAMHSGS